MHVRIDKRVDNHTNDFLPDYDFFCLKKSALLFKKEYMVNGIYGKVRAKSDEI